MRLDQLTLVLRPRSPWEAMELGGALVRVHARTIWLAWLLVSLPVFVAINALGLAFGVVEWASVLMWWLKPVFDRIPLYVLSRGAFGDAPSVRDTVRAQLRWGWNWMPAHLLWRRLSPVRSLLMPVDLLEGGKTAGQRRKVIGGSVRGTAALLTLACVNFELMLLGGAFALVMMFVPLEYLSESARAAWALLMSVETPPWADVTINAAVWLATSLIEPFYVGAGFGIYLDRRTRLEAWDVEIAFRRMRQRLAAAATSIVCVACVGLLVLVAPGMARAMDDPPAAHAQAEQPASRRPANATKAPAVQEETLRKVFAQVEDDAGFRESVEQAYDDPLLSPEETEKKWVPRDPEERKSSEFDSPFLKGLAVVLAAIGEYGLWIAVAFLLGLLAWTRRTWWPWLRRMAPVAPGRETPVSSEALTLPDALPDDIAAEVRALWAEGRKRRALALLYRASVDAMVRLTGAVLVPGATEAECLRAARAMHDTDDRDAFNQAVRVWQYAAYADRLPGDADFEALLGRLSSRFGWLR